MNIQEALVEARKQEKAIKRAGWDKNKSELYACKNSCIYHGIDNMMRWYEKDEEYNRNGEEYVFSVSELLTTDWELVDWCHYHGPHYKIELPPLPDLKYAELGKKLEMIDKLPQAGKANYEMGYIKTEELPNGSYYKCGGKGKEIMP